MAGRKIRWNYFLVCVFVCMFFVFVFPIPRVVSGVLIFSGCLILWSGLSGLGLILPCRLETHMVRQKGDSAHVFVTFRSFSCPTGCRSDKDSTFLYRWFDNKLHRYLPLQPCTRIERPHVLTGNMPFIGLQCACPELSSANGWLAIPVNCDKTMHLSLL